MAPMRPTEAIALSRAGREQRNHPHAKSDKQRDRSFPMVRACASTVVAKKEIECMKFFKVVLPVFGMALLGTAFSSGAKADEWDKKTEITFSQPVEIPGVHLPGWGVLPAGTYIFKLLDSRSDRHIVQILNREGTVVYATILAIPNYRLQATDKTVITFRERPAGQPEALRAWFYPGRNWGDEFVYPKAMALELAKSTNTPVLFTPAEIPVEVTESVKSVDQPVVAELARAPIMAIKPTGEEVQLAEVVTPPPVEVTAIQPLPATASSVPLIALAGLLALASALAIRVAEKHFR